MSDSSVEVDALEYLFDAYNGSGDGVDGLSAGYTVEHGQSLLGDEGYFTGASWRIYKGGSPTGNIVARIYTHTGTYGTSSVPTGTYLAESDPIDVSTLSGSPTVQRFTFTGNNRIRIHNQYYVITIRYTGGGGANFVGTYIDTTLPTHAGNKSHWNGSSWTATAGHDRIFYAWYQPVGLTSVVPDLSGYQASQTDESAVAKTVSDITGAAKVVSDGAISSLYSLGDSRITLGDNWTMGGNPL